MHISTDSSVSADIDIDWRRSKELPVQCDIKQPHSDIETSTPHTDAETIANVHEPPSNVKVTEDLDKVDNVRTHVEITSVLTTSTPSKQQQENDVGADHSTYGVSAHRATCAPNHDTNVGRMRGRSRGGHGAKSQDKVPSSPVVQCGSQGGVERNSTAAVLQRLREKGYTKGIHNGRSRTYALDVPHVKKQDTGSNLTSLSDVCSIIVSISGRRGIQRTSITSVLQRLREQKAVGVKRVRQQTKDDLA